MSFLTTSADSDPLRDPGSMQMDAPLRSCAVFVVTYSKLHTPLIAESRHVVRGADKAKDPENPSQERLLKPNQVHPRR